MFAKCYQFANFYYLVSKNGAVFSPRFGYKLVKYENCAIFSYDCTRNIVDYPFKGLALK